MKRKWVWFLLCGVAITGIMCVMILQKGFTKSEIFDYVQGNQADLERFAVELMRVNGKDANGFQGVELDFIQDGDGWIWREPNGDNCNQTERITEHWFWFKMSF